MDRHHTMENYIAVKSRIFENQSERDITVLGYDNEITRAMKPPGRVVYFSTKEELDAGVFLRDGYIVADGVKIAEMASLKIMPENALAATALSLCAGVSADTIAAGLAAFTGVAHRMEYVTTVNGVEYFNDSKATNTDSAIKAIESANTPIVLIGGGYDKNTDFTPWIKSFGDKVKKLVIIGETTQKIVDTCEFLGFTSYVCAGTLQEAVAVARQAALPGWQVVFSPACASFDMFKNFEERGDMFKDIVRSMG